MRRSLIIGLVLSLGIYGLALFGAFGLPGVLKIGNLDTLLALKRKEELAYLMAMFLVPVVAVFLARLVQGSAHPSIPPPQPVPRRRSSGSLAVVSIGLLLTLVPQRAGKTLIDPMDDGLRLVETAEVERGRALYSEVSLNYGPLYEIAQTKLGFALFGANAGALHKIDQLVAPVAYVALFLLAWRVVRLRWLVVALLLMMLGKSFFAVTPRLALPGASLGLLIWSWQTRNTRRQIGLQVASGVLLSLGCLYSLEAGLLLAATFFSFYLLLIINAHWQAKALQPVLKEWGLVLVGVGLLAAPFGLWLLATGRLIDFVWNLEWITRSSLIVGGKPTPVLWGPVRGVLANPLSLFTAEGAVARLWFPPLLFVTVLTVLFQDGFSRHFRNQRRPLLLVTLAAIFFFFVTLGRWDFDHWLKATGLFWVLAVMVLDDLAIGITITWKKDKVKAVPFLLGATYLGALLLTHVSVVRIWDAVRIAPAEWQKLLAPAAADPIGIPSYPVEARARITGVVERIQRYSGPSDPIFIFSNDASFYFLADRRNATPYALECYILTPHAVSNAISSLQRSDPPLIVARAQGDGFASRVLQQPLADFLTQQYHPVDTYDGFVFLTRRN